MEYLPTDLPKYVKITPRSAVANSVVRDGHVLLISEDGITITSKNSNGTYTQIGDGSTNFYKCASIDTVNHTWTGYKAVQDSSTKIWSFEKTLTTDSLTYLEANSIVVNGVYNADASVSAHLYEGLPTDGIVFYHPLESGISTLPSGQNVTTVGSPSFSTIDGIPCCTFDGNSYIKMEDLTTVPTGNNSRTVSFWMKTAALYGSDDYGYVGYGYASTRQWFITLSNSYGFGASLYGTDLYLSQSDTPVNTWHHIAVTLDSGVLSIYVDGSKKSYQSVSANTSTNGILTIGASPYSSSDISKKLVGSMAAVRIYNRALTSAEIQLLAGEFTPTQGA